MVWTSSRRGFLFALLGVSLSCAAWAQPVVSDPLPSWNDGAVKSSITDFVARVTREGSPEQTQVGGLAVAPAEVQAALFIVRIRLDDTAIAKALPAGSTGLAAIYTDHVKAAHVIRKVVLRQAAIMNYVVPF
jgi:hypothetical protein